ncbi:MAG: beta-ketoacyl synthase chain length factor [Ferruginibacter sp.]
MSIYIRATGNISPQNTFGHPPFLKDIVEYSSNRLSCVEPDYKNIIDVKLIRRMSRIIRMGVAAAIECLQEGEIPVPDAIVTGTAYGCLEDTAVFLGKMVEFKEELLTPTAFIQSTHNTIGGQIGLMLKCNNYNNAFVHRGFSFESALLDAMMLLNENDAQHVLVGAIDEITNASHSILNRLGLFRQGSVSNIELFSSRSKGTLNGEGASFFFLAKEQSDTDYAKLEGLSTFYKPADNNEIEDHISRFLSKHSTTFNDIDIIITGRNGDLRSDKIFDDLDQGIFKNRSVLNYKHLCGEYPTSAAFALWVAVNILKRKELPVVFNARRNNPMPPKRILIYNHYLGIHHSLLLVKAC